jgi:hypothetical protein
MTIGLSTTALNAIRSNANPPELPMVNEESKFRLYSFNCSYWHGPTGTILVYTQDKGNSKIGLEDPLLNNALHLSLAFTKPDARGGLVNKPAQNTPKGQIPRRPFDWELAGEWLTTLFGDIPDDEDSYLTNLRQLWREGNGAKEESVHFFLFCDDNWRPHKLSQKAIDELVMIHQLQSVTITKHIASFR